MSFVPVDPVATAGERPDVVVVRQMRGGCWTSADKEVALSVAVYEVQGTL